jgi:hypothetical protein
MTDAASKAKLFGSIQSRQDATHFLRQASHAYYAAGALQLLVGAFMKPPQYLDGIAYAVLGYCCYRFRSVQAALLLFLMSIVSVVTTVATKLGLAAHGGTNIVLALIVTALSARVLEATLKLRGTLALKNEPAGPASAPAPSSRWEAPANDLLSALLVVGAALVFVGIALESFHLEGTDGWAENGLLLTVLAAWASGLYLAGRGVVRGVRALKENPDVGH